jgi:predicted lipoprotein with Yx(FWY)xxD motif
MTRLIVLAGMAVVALAVAACGGTSGGAYGGGGGSTASKTSSGKGSVALASTKLGKVLVDGKGRTLYLFEADKGTSSKCDGACASAWPPLTSSGKPTAGAGVFASKLGTAKRPDGTTGVTYDGHPLYTYAGDTAPGQTAGEGLTDYGAPWYALSAAGKTVVG